MSFPPLSLRTPFDGFTLLKTRVTDYQHRQQGNDRLLALLDFSVGNPDLGPGDHWQQRLNHYINDATLHGYGEFRSDINLNLKRRFAAYYHRRFYPAGSVELLDPARHVLDLLGSKEGIFYSLLSSVKPGESILLPDPSYSVYSSCAELIGIDVESFPCDEAGQPDFKAINAQQLISARLLILCSPNNPTGIELTEQTLITAIAFCRRHQLILVLDRAYAEISAPPVNPSQGLGGSALGYPGALDCTIELHSLSKSCGIAGWRIGFAVGNELMIERLKKFKFQSDFGMFLPFQQVAAEMLDKLASVAAQHSSVYRRRIIRVVHALREMGWEVATPEAGFFLWAKIPATLNLSDDLEFTQALLNEAGLLFTPGSGFGDAGRGYVRIALVHEDPVLDQMITRLSGWLTQRTCVAQVRINA